MVLDDKLVSTFAMNKDTEPGLVTQFRNRDVSRVTPS